MLVYPHKYYTTWGGILFQGIEIKSERNNNVGVEGVENDETKSEEMD